MPTWKLLHLPADDDAPLFSLDPVIEAHLCGGEVDLPNTLTDRSSLFRENLQRSKEAAEVLRQILLERGDQILGMWMNPKSVSSFKLLILVPESDYLDDDFLEIYEASIDLKKRLNQGEDFHLAIIFAPDSAGFSEAQAEADGFILRYEAQ